MARDRPTGVHFYPVAVIDEQVPSRPIEVQVTVGSQTDVAPEPAELEGIESLLIGCEGQLSNLKKTELNNQQGRIKEWNVERRRFVVRGHELLLKPGNLRNAKGDQRAGDQQNSPRGMHVDGDQRSDKDTTAWAIAPSDECVKMAFVLIDDEACNLFANKARSAEGDEEVRGGAG